MVGNVSQSSHPRSPPPRRAVHRDAPFHAKLTLGPDPRHLRLHRPRHQAPLLFLQPPPPRAHHGRRCVWCYRSLTRVWPAAPNRPRSGFSPDPRPPRDRGTDGFPPRPGPSPLASRLTMIPRGRRGAIQRPIDPAPAPSKGSSRTNSQVVTTRRFSCRLSIRLADHAPPHVPPRFDQDTPTTRTSTSTTVTSPTSTPSSPSSATSAPPRFTTSPRSRTCRCLSRCPCTRRRLTASAR